MYRNQTHILMNHFNLTKGFRELRKHGYWSKQNHTCCQTCGWSEVPEGKEDKVVFYHQQDNEDKVRHRPFYLCWSGDGHEITRILNECGVQTDWDGSENRRIRVESW